MREQGHQDYVRYAQHTFARAEHDLRDLGQVRDFGIKRTAPLLFRATRGGTSSVKGLHPNGHGVAPSDNFAFLTFESGLFGDGQWWWWGGGSGRGSRVAY